jgi:hypothetical protein
MNTFLKKPSKYLKYIFMYFDKNHDWIINEK